MTSEFLIVAEQVLRKSEVPLTAREITDEGMDQGLFSDNVAGKTPYQTMKSKLSVCIRKHGSRTNFIRTGKGKFWLRDKVKPDAVYSAKPYEKPPAHEHVLALPPNAVRERIRFQGIDVNWRKYARLLRPQNVDYLDRMLAEETDSHKQVLTYVLVTRGSSVLCFRRGKFNRAEDFLRGALCIGFGGHVTQDDYSLLSGSDLGLVDSARRELLEELSLPEKDVERLSRGEGLSVCGVLNDDSSAVGRRHFAFVMRFEVSDDPAWDNPIRGEKSIAQLQWISAENGPHEIWKFEYWSQLCLRKYFPRMASTTSDFRIIRRRPFSAPHVLVLIGSIGSGKTEAAKMLVEQFDYSEVNSGKLLSSILGIDPVDRSDRATFQKAALAFIRTKNGPRRLAQAICIQASRKTGSRILVDGIRQRETLNELSRLLLPTRTAVLYVHTLPDIAYEFFSGRGGAPVAFSEFLKLRDAEVEKEVPKFLSLADAVVYNWRGKRRYLQTLRTLMRQLDPP